MLQAALAQRRLAAAAMPAMPRPPSRAASPTTSTPRLPFTLTAARWRWARPSPRAGLRLPDAPAAAGRGRLGQDGDRDPGDAPGGGRGRPGGAARADRGAGAAALPVDHRHARAAGRRAGQLGAAEHATGVALLTGSVGAAARRAALSDVFTGDAGIVIGTHALLEEQVQFADLGLVVIDEQHRFGVEQRDALRAKAADNRPHVLVMTATPIPRTVAMTVYGDLETSTLTELPAGRSAIATHVVPAADKPRYLERAWERVREEVGRGPAGLRGVPAHRRRPGSRIDEAEYPTRTTSAQCLPGGRPRQPPGGHGAHSPRGASGGRRQPLAVLDVAATLDAGPLAGLRLAHPARQAAPGGEGPGDAGVLRGRDRRPGGDHGDRGRRRRAERDRDGDHGRRAVRRLPAAPAPRPGRPGHRAGPVPAGQRGAARQPGAGAAGRGGRHPGRVRAVPARPRAAPGGRRAGRRAGRAASPA